MAILGLNIEILVRTMFDTWHDLASCGVTDYFGRKAMAATEGISVGHGRTSHMAIRAR